MQRLEREIRVDGAGAVAEQQRDMVHFARVTGLDEQAALGARPFAHQVMVHARGREQARNRRVRRIDAAVRENQDAVAGGHGLTRLAAQLGHRALEPRTILIRVVQQRQRRRTKRRARRQMPKLRDLVVVQNRILDLDLPAGLAAPRRAGCPRARWSRPSTSPAPREWRRAADW